MVVDDEVDVAEASRVEGAVTCISAVVCRLSEDDEAER
jgi:hypothetical protein